MKAIFIAVITAFSSGKYAGAPFSFSAGARGVAIGSAMSPLASGASALSWNPSGLAHIDGKQLLLDHMSSFSNLVSVNTIMAGMKKGEWGIGAGLYLVSSSGITATERDSTGRIVPAGEFGYSFSTLYFGAARGHFGVTVKAIHEAIDTVSAVGLGIDVGVQKSFNGIAIGGVIHNISSTPLIWSTGRKELILPDMRLGIAYTYKWITSVAEAEVRFENMGAEATFGIGIVSVDPHIGVEMKIKQKIIESGDYFSVRAGVDRTVPTFGAGFRTKWASVDYAFLSHTLLGESHRISITVNF